MSQKLLEAAKTAMAEMHIRDVRTAIREGWARLPTKDQVKLRREFKPIVRLDYTPHEILLGCESLVELEMRAQSVSKEPELVQWIEESFKEGETRTFLKRESITLGEYGVLFWFI